MNMPLFSVNANRRATGQSIRDIAMNARKAAEAHPDCFVSVLSVDQIEVQVAKVEGQLAKDMPLAGLTFCVKDNINVAGHVSTGNCPTYGTEATQTAHCVQKAMDAGAILIGKNTMDQFATGLNGTRSPDPICRNSIDPTIIPGGSSSGSAVAVAKDICDFSFGSDTGGSGRVPAATNGIVGFKPTPGLMSGRGMVYCNRSFDVMPIFAKSIAEASCVFDVVGGADPFDPFAFQGSVLAASEKPGLNYAIPAALNHFGDAAAEAAHQANLKRLQNAGATLTEIDFAPFAEAGGLVFGSAFVAERLVDYGDFIAENPDSVLPPVAQAINAGRSYSARDAFEAMYRLAELKLECVNTLNEFDALVLPTIPRLFTVSEMLADPMPLNSIMGTYTYFANPLGLSAVAVPGAQRTDGLPSSVCFVGQGGSDKAVLQQASAFAAT